MLTTRRHLLSGAWTPKRIAGLTFWYNLSKQVGYADTDPVGQLDDFSSGYHLTQGTAANKPLYSANVQNGLPGLLFDGTDDSLVNTDFPSTSPRTMIAAGKYTGASSGELRILIDGNSAINANQMGHTATANTFRVHGGTSLDNAVSDDTVPFIWTAVINGTSSLNRWNGDEAAGNSGTSTPTGIRLGRANINFWKGYLFELVGYNRALSSGEYLRLESYLKLKWGISY
jgi:hypothetical protein